MFVVRHLAFVLRTSDTLTHDSAWTVSDGAEVVCSKLPTMRSLDDINPPIRKSKREYSQHFLWYRINSS